MSLACDSNLLTSLSASTQDNLGGAMILLVVVLHAVVVQWVLLRFSYASVILSDKLRNLN